MSDQVRIRVFVDGELAAEDDLVSLVPREVASAHASLLAEALAGGQPWLIEINDPQTGHGLRFGTEVEAIERPSVALVQAPDTAQASDLIDVTIVDEHRAFGRAEWTPAKGLVDCQAPPPKSSPATGAPRDYDG